MVVMENPLQVEVGRMTAKITSMDMHEDSNYVSYNDSEPITDYFHGLSLGQADTIEWLRKDGAEIIKVDFVNQHRPENMRLYKKRLDKIAKALWYEVFYESEERMNPGGGKWIDNWAWLKKPIGGENDGESKQVQRITA